MKVVSVPKLAMLIPSLAGVGSFIGGILLLLGGLLVLGFAIALLGILLMLFCARLMANQIAQQQATPQLGQELAQQHGQQQTPQQSIVSYPPFPPTVILLPSQDNRRTQERDRTPRQYVTPQGRTKICPLCDSVIPEESGTCPSCGVVLYQNQTTQ